MGIIDDHYGGYENLALWTDADGNVDFDGAYYGAAGLGPEFPGETGRYCSDSGDDEDGYDDGFGGGLGPQAAGDGLQSSSAHPDPLTRSKLAAVLAGTFEAPTLTGDARFAATVSQLAAAQAAAGGRPGAVAYRSDRYIPAPSGTSRSRYRGEREPAWTTTGGACFGALVGSRHAFSWWEAAGGPRQTEPSVRFYNYADVREHYELGMAGPAEAPWCVVPAEMTASRRPGFDANLFWSVAVLWRETGSCGVRAWDEQLAALAAGPAQAPPPPPRRW
jgi:hypothetical protein